jgi:hypothetical protein
VLIFLLIALAVGQGLAAGQTPDDSQGDDSSQPPGEVIDDDSGSEEPDDPPETDPPPSDGDGDGTDDPPTDVPEEPSIVPTEPVAEPPVPTDVPAEDPDPTDPPEDSDPESTAFPTEDDSNVPTETPTPTETPEEIPEPEPTDRPANVDSLSAIDVASGVVLQPGESASFTYSYVVSTSRVGTTLSAGLTGETDGWTIALYAGSSESGPGLEVTTVETGTLGAGGSFGVTAIVTAPTILAGPQAIAFWISSSATPDDGSPEEIGISANGPTVSLVDPSTQTPTSTPTETPTPTMTPEPVIPFEPVVICNPNGDSGSAWALQKCDVTWQTENVSALLLLVSASTPDWTVVAVTTNEAERVEMLEASDGQIELVSDSKSMSSQFVIATKLGCSAAPTAELSLEFTATSILPVPTDAEGNPLPDVVETRVTETTTSQISSQGRTATAPMVTISSASFVPVDISDGRRSTEGTVNVSYSDVPVGCAWQITLAYGDLVNGDHEIPVANLELVDVTGFDQAAVSHDQGTFVITPPANTTTASGSFVITVSLELPDTIPEGSYATTITASIELLP